MFHSDRENRQFFVKKRNVICECAKFNSGCQHKGESVDNFITDLHCLAKICGYGELHSEMIRDRIVVGLLDDGLSKKMQLDPILTLEKAVSMARQSEAVHNQQGIVRGTSHDSGELQSENLEAVTSWFGNKTKSAIQKHKSPGKTTVNEQPTKGQRRQGDKCQRSGKKPWHKRQQCPPKDAQCYKCQRTRHYSAYCYARQISTVTEDTENTFLGAIELDRSIQWLSTIELNQMKVTFKLDTGAEATAISAETTFQK